MATTPLTVDASSARRLRAVLSFCDHIHRTQRAHTLMAAHPVARLLAEASRQHLSAILEWSVVTAFRSTANSGACLTSLKNVGTRHVYRHVYSDMCAEALLVRRLESMAWWIARAPLLDLSLRLYEPVLGPALAALLAGLCRHGMATMDDGSETSAALLPSTLRPQLRRLHLDDADSIDSPTLLGFLRPLRESLEVLSLSNAHLSTLLHRPTVISSVVTLNLSHSALPALAGLLVCFPRLEALTLEACTALDPVEEEIVLARGLDVGPSDRADVVATGHARIHFTGDKAQGCTLGDSGGAPGEGKNALGRHLARLAPRLTWLSLNAVAVAYMPHFRWIACFTELRHIDLNFSKQTFILDDVFPHTGDPTVPTLTPAPPARLHLESLSLRSTRISDLSRLRDAPRLQVLNLTSCLEVASLEVFRLFPCGLHLRHLHLSNTAITSIEPLAAQYCPSLETLLLDGCAQVTSFEPLVGAAHLSELDVSGTDIDDLSWVSSCPRLSILRVHDCARLTSGALCTRPLDAAAPPPLALLSFIDASASGLTSLAGWAACDSLASLSLHQCGRLLHLDGLAGAPRLTTLNLRHATGLTRVDGLRACPRLANVVLDFCACLCSLEGLDGSVSLSTLSVSTTAITRLPRGCAALHTMIARDCLDLHDVSGLVDARGLSVLDLRRSPVEDVSMLHTHAQLTRVMLDKTSLSSACAHDVGFLRASRTGLSEVVLSENEHIRTLAGLEGCVALKMLWIDKCPAIEDLGSLAACITLVHLALDGTAVQSLAPLATCVSLKDVSLADCHRVRSLAGLGGLPGLTTIRASRVPLDDIDVVATMSSLQELHLDVSETLTEESITRTMRARSPTCEVLRIMLGSAGVDSVTKVLRWPDGKAARSA